MLGARAGGEIGSQQLEPPANETDAAAWIDRAAILSVAAETLDRPTLVLKALSAALRGVELAPDSPVAHFNLALLLETVGARRQARLAWQEFLRVEHDPEWLAEAEARLRNDLALPSDTERWNQLEPREFRFSNPSDPDSRLDLAQEWLEFLGGEGLRIVAQSLTEGIDPPAWLGRAASAVAKSTGEALLPRILEQAQGCSPPTCESLSQALRQHLAAREALDRYSPAEARLALDPPGPGWGKLPKGLGSHTLADWNLYFRAMIAYQSGQRREALGLAIAGAKEANRNDSPSLEGRAARLAAVVETDLLRPESALPWLERAAGCFKRTGELGRLAAIDSLLATTYADLGQGEKSWHHRLRSLRRASRHGDMERLPMLFGIAAVAASELGEGNAALALLAETFDYQMAAGSALDKTETLWWRAQIRHGRGAHEKALEDVRLARKEAHSIGTEAARLACLAGLWRLEGRLLLDTEPAQAFEAFSKALEAAQELELDYQIGEAHRLRGLAAERQGNFELARQELATAVEVIEGKRGEIENRTHRIQFFDQARPVFEDLAQLHTRLEEPLVALQWASHGRARELQNVWMTRPSKDHATASFATAALPPHGTPSHNPATSAFYTEAIPPGDSLAVFEVLEHTTLVWWLEADTIRQIDLGASRQEMRSLVEAWVGGLRSGGGDSGSSAEIFRRLVRPWLPAPGTVTRLVVAPDEMLASLPWLALRDPASNRFLIEDFEVLITPGANLAMAEWLSNHPWHRPESLLAVAADREIPGLSPLPGARQELRDIVPLYDRSIFLEDRQATEWRFAAEAGLHEVVHFAGHAEASSGRRAGRLHFGPGDALTLDAIANLDLEATRLMILSACETHRDERIGLEGPVTLASAFLSVGVPQTLATLWPVEDDTARKVTQRFHHYLLAGHRPSTALRNALLDLLADNDRSSNDLEAEDLPTRSWAPFQLLGIPFAPPA